MALSEMNLVEAGNRRPLGEIPDRRAHRALARLALDGKERLALLQDDEIDLPPVGVAQDAKLHPMAVPVFEPVAMLEQLTGREVSERGPFSGTVDQSQR